MTVPEIPGFRFCLCRGFFVKRKARHNHKIITKYLTIRRLRRKPSPQNLNLLMIWVITEAMFANSRDDSLVCDAPRAVCFEAVLIP